ncbi:hypothetical protein NDI45_12710 [Leptolyngbya sp. GB1-A1]|uniref:hypothetical protein n=1 Tax=Leptolyngbya sp. GB1-A1 TaxID=2933908 RepID=UPI00329976E3
MTIDLIKATAKRFNQAKQQAAAKCTHTPDRPCDACLTASLEAIKASESPEYPTGEDAA